MKHPDNSADPRNQRTEKQVQRLVAGDPLLKPYQTVLSRRLARAAEVEARLTRASVDLADFAAGHTYFGLHFQNGGWCFREWAPNAQRIYLISPATDWRESDAWALKPLGENGDWELCLPAGALSHGDLYRLRIHWPGGSGDRLPAYARRVVQDPHTLIFNAQVWHPAHPYLWRHRVPETAGDPLHIYEAHVGMAQDAKKIGTYAEFTDNILPRIAAAGYNTVQLMAVQEHPYYASFGYQVSNFFAAASRFGTPYELKALVDAAHGHGLRVLMDLVHSHAVANEVEGLSRFDGTDHQYFHGGPRGFHGAWNSRCFDYGKLQVLHFLLSNCRFWLDEYGFDGFRFDGITSMLYHDHGLGKAFSGYDDYFGDNVDEDAFVYLVLANRVVHKVRPDAVTIAEDMSGMPGLAAARKTGGVGFDYRFAMGIPDFWIELTKDTPDEHWPMGRLWYELNNRRADEKTISYAESHDQALVGDQTLIFRLIGAEMYHHMRTHDTHPGVDRGIALHKMIRLITLATAGHGYLNFMGNEFGHPEWIDFPREGNNWSYHYARRQWHLADDPNLKYHQLARFDRDMLAMAGEHRLLQDTSANLLAEHNEHKIIAFQRAGLVLAFNFHPHQSFSDYRFRAPAAGTYRHIFDSDAPRYGGHGRIAAGTVHHTLKPPDGGESDRCLSLYLPCRTAQVLCPR